MTTRRQLKELFKNIAESHKQINSFGWGDVPEILSRQDHIYPLMMVTPSDVINEQGQIKHTYIISVADRLKKDISNQVDVDNDTQQIMADLIAIFYNIDYQNLSVELPLNITPFKNIDPQDVIGWFGTFSLIVDENYDYCAVPTEPIPFDPDPPFVCAPANYRVQYVGGELIEEGEIPSGGSVTVNVPVCPESGSVEWELRDEDNNLLDSGTQPAGVPLTITAPDALVTIKDSDDTVLYVFNVNSGGTATQIINDSTVNINKSDGSLIFAQDVKAEATENYNVADSVITLNNTVPTLISTTNVKATDTATIVAPDATVTVNGDNSFPTIPSGGSVNIGVENTNGAPVGAFDSNTNSWVINNGTLNVNKSDGSLISASTLAAENTDSYNVADSVAVLKDTLGNTISSTNIKATESEDIVAPDATFNLDNTSGATLFLGSIAAGDNETIIAPDGDIENSDASYTASVESGGVLVLPDQTIEVNTVNEGSIPSVGTIEIDITDGTNPVTPDSVDITGRKVTIEVPTMNVDFSADKLTASQGETITFTDLTDNSPTHWSWRFDSVGESIVQNPTFSFLTMGFKNITLLAAKTGLGGFTTKTGYIEVVVDPDVAAFLTATGITDPIIEGAINKLVLDLKIAGIWTKMKAIYPFVGGTATTHKYNLKDPQDTNAAFRLVFSGGWTHSANGALPNGTNAFADTFLVPNTSLLLNSAHISGYVRNNVGVFAPILSSEDASTFNNGLYIWPRTTTNDYSVRINDNTSAAAVAFDSRGFHLATRTASNVKKYFRNNLSVFSLTTASIALNSSSIYIGASRNNANFSTHETAFNSIGEGLSDPETSAFYTAVQTFQTTLGRQV